MSGVRIRLSATGGELHRHLGRRQVILLSVGGQIGSAWLFAVLSSASITRPSAILSWLVAGAVFAVIALPWAKLGRLLPMNGAVSRYPHITHGAITGWMMAWAGWLFAVSIPPLEAVAVLTYLGSQFPGLGLLSEVDGTVLLSWPRGVTLAVAIMILFAVINMLGGRLSSRVTDYVTIWKIIIPTVTFIALFLVFNSSNFSIGGFLPAGPSAILNAISVSGIAFAFVGFRQALDFGAELEDPTRDTRWALIASIAIPTALYVCLQISFIGSLDWAAAGVAPGDWAALAESPWASGPFFHALNAAGMAGFGALAVVLLTDAVLSPAGAGWIYAGNSARVVLAMARDRAVPRTLGFVDRRGVPTIAILVSVAVGCVFLVPAPGWYRLVSFVSAAGVLTFLAGGTSLAVILKGEHLLKLGHKGRSRLREIWPSAISFVGAALVIYWAGFQTYNTLFVVMIFGLLVKAILGWPRQPSRTRVQLLAFNVSLLAAFLVMTWRSGYFLATTIEPSAWPFPMYLAAMTIVVAVWIVATCLVDRSQAHSVLQSLWLHLTLLALLPISYWGSYGPTYDQIIEFPIDLLVLVVVALICFSVAVTTGLSRPE
ncbi:APC family permease [Pseudonocardia sp. RS010]|uniref:APC family permease n=1 Tax=Pseudonocardia sp. RS010 TaxID=3385979 RepID=UPI0039A124A3